MAGNKVVVRQPLRIGVIGSIGVVLLCGEHRALIGRAFEGKLRYFPAKSDNMTAKKAWDIPGHILRCYIALRNAKAVGHDEEVVDRVQNADRMRNEAITSGDAIGKT
ncbi:uncharacterized protein N7477_009503 [Penicillium maclennaniae]|uniref:uncharacterized protein n=1 Tax=Penicillium maclennaniae TaxID=1343394 RepID=UPI002540D555|nr:uncharacterized protein N7477_009503 [Penicillium maclennaniae]KAJ5661887.1 hypothetical protein N7477_009503 [Penicillium maclennaniae]